METLVVMAAIVLIVLIVQGAEVLKLKYKKGDASDEGNPDL